MLKKFRRRWRACASLQKEVGGGNTTPVEPSLAGKLLILFPIYFGAEYCCLFVIKLVNDAGCGGAPLHQDEHRHHQLGTGSGRQRRSASTPSLSPNTKSH